MDQFATEEQQVEAIKRFWKENGLAIIAGAVIGLGGLWGWRYYNTSQLTAKEQASSSYQSAVEALATDEENAALSEFVNSTDSVAYKAIGSLVLAKEHIDEGNLDAAASLFQDIMAAEKTSPLASVAALRLAEVQLQQGKHEAVLSTVTSIEDDAFQAQALSLKGDALVALSRFDEARQAYSAALEKTPEDMQVQMKLDNLATSTVGA